MKRTALDTSRNVLFNRAISIATESHQRLIQVKKLWNHSLKDQLEIGRLLYEERAERLSVGGREVHEGFHQWLRDAGIPKTSGYRRIAEYEISIGQRNEEDKFDKPKPVPVGTTLQVTPEEVRRRSDNGRLHPKDSRRPENADVPSGMPSEPSVSAGYKKAVKPLPPQPSVIDLSPESQSPESEKLTALRMLGRAHNYLQLPPKNEGKVKAKDILLKHWYSAYKRLSIRDFGAPVEQAIKIQRFAAAHNARLKARNARDADIARFNARILAAHNAHNAESEPTPPPATGKNPETFSFARRQLAS